MNEVYLKSWLTGYLLGVSGKKLSINPGQNTIATGCITFSSSEPFTLSVSNNEKNWDGILEYSIDSSTWTEWDGTVALDSGIDNRLYMRGSGNSVITGGNYRNFIISGSDVRCEGNIENLLDYETVEVGEHPVMAANCYHKMFFKCTSLITPPELPATTLVEHCYDSMFYNCTSLITPPELPATTLAEYCYYSMFLNCTSLITPPELPATTLSEYCYGFMFRNCTSLIALPELPATTLPKHCYYSMFSFCEGIKLSATQDDEYWREYRIPQTGDAVSVMYEALYGMFSITGGTFTGTPIINTTYYTNNPVVSASEPNPVYE